MKRLPQVHELATRLRALSARFYRGEVLGQTAYARDCSDDLDSAASVILLLHLRLAQAMKALEPFAIDGCSDAFEARDDEFASLSAIADGRRHWIAEEDFRMAKRIYASLRHLQKYTGSEENDD